MLVTAVPHDGLDAALERQLHDLVVAAFDGDFTPDDWEHARGGWHVCLVLGGSPVAHAAVVPRVLHADGVSYRTGYVEAVATRADLRGRGLGTQVMEVVGELVRTQHELGALSTGEHGFYARLGWERWQGPTCVRTDAGEVRTPEDDDGVMVLRHGRSASLALTATLSCEPRAGDVW